MHYTMQRFWEIDTIRGIAICMMFVYHFFFDLTFFNIYPLPLDTIGFQVFLYPIGTLFLLLVGISLALSNQRKKQQNPTISTKSLFLTQLIRGLSIFSLGMIITVVTYLYPHQGFIRFGVLHCIGLSIILSFLFINYRIISGIFGAIIITLGILIQPITVSTSHLLWLGLKPSQFYTLDYFPLLPWFRVILIGIFIGNSLYKNNSRLYTLVDMSDKIIIKSLSYLGRHSLVIYFIHQPIILSLLYPFM